MQFGYSARLRLSWQTLQTSSCGTLYNLSHPHAHLDRNDPRRRVPVSDVTPDAPVPSLMRRDGSWAYSMRLRALQGLHGGSHGCVRPKQLQQSSGPYPEAPTEWLIRQLCPPD